MRVGVLWIAAALVGTPLAAAAQTEINITITRRGNDLTITSTSIRGPDGQRRAFDPASEQQIAAGASLIVNLDCTAPVDCRQVDLAMLSRQEQSGGVAPATPSRGERKAEWEFTPDLFGGKDNLRLQVRQDGAEITQIPLSVSTTSPQTAVVNTPPQNPGTNTTATDTPQAGSALSEPLTRLRTYDCVPELSALSVNMGERTYFRGLNLARILMDANGNVWNRPQVDLMDENDLLQVTVIAHPDLLRALRVRRTSAFRIPGVLSIVGADATVPSLGGRKSTQRVACGAYTILLGDFQPGRGEITVSAITDKGDVTTGTAELGVNTLYAGAFALGAIRTELRDPQFGLVWNGADSVITRTEDRTPRTLYTLTYTPFIWGKRDLEKRESMLHYRRLNPMFGIVLSDIQNNFVAGATYDLVSAVYLSGGVHLGRVRRLNPDAGYAVGEAFPGNRDQLPTTRDWRHKVFVGVSLDLRAASQFIQKAIGTPAS